MFDLSFAEIVVIAVIAIIVIKPDDLPGILRAIGKAFGKVKELANEFAGVFDDVEKSSGISETKQEFKNIIDLEGKVRKAYDVSEIADLEDPDRKRKIN